MTTNEKKDLWVQWACDAVSQFSMPEVDNDSNDIVNDMVDIATSYADLMLEEFENRFGGGTAKSKRSKRRQTEEDEE
jgi:hypothetical protein